MVGMFSSMGVLVGVSSTVPVGGVAVGASVSSVTSNRSPVSVGAIVVGVSVTGAIVGTSSTSPVVGDLVGAIEGTADVVGGFVVICKRRIRRFPLLSVDDVPTKTQHTSAPVKTTLETIIFVAVCGDVRPIEKKVMVVVHEDSRHPQDFAFPGMSRVRFLIIFERIILMGHDVEPACR
jgi:hypothetical protein